MRKWIAVLFSVFFAFTPPAFTAIPETVPLVQTASDTDGVQVPIPFNCRVKNFTGVQCVWSSLSTLAKYHDVGPAKNLTDKYKKPANDVSVQRALDPLGVKYVQHRNKDKQVLIDACAKGWGAAVSVYGTHMITLVHFKDGQVKVIDNLDPDLKIKTMSEAQFMKIWDGWSVSLIPPTPAVPDLAPRRPSEIK